MKGDIDIDVDIDTDSYYGVYFGIIVWALAFFKGR